MNTWKYLQENPDALLPLLPYSMELLRTLVDEANVSFKGAAVAIALVWTLFFSIESGSATLQQERI